MRYCLPLILAVSEAFAQNPAPRALSGRVIDAETKQILHHAAVKIRAASMERDAFTDDSGDFTFARIPTGDFDILVHRSGYSDYQGKIGKQSDVALIRQGVIAGKVSDSSGAPVEGVTIEVLSGNPAIPVAKGAREWLTNDFGEYRIFGLNAGAYQVRASFRKAILALHPPRNDKARVVYFGGTGKRETLWLTAGEVRGKIDFVIDPYLETQGAASRTDLAGKIHLRLIDADTKQPLPGKRVVLSTLTPPFVAGMTDERGEFHAGIPNGPVKLLNVPLSGYSMLGGPQNSRAIYRQPGEDVEMTLQMIPLGALAGRVLDQHGDPVSDADVRVLQPKLEHDGRTHYQSKGYGTTDDRGEFRISGIVGGEHFIAESYISGGAEQSALQPSSRKWRQLCGFAFYPNARSIEAAEKALVVPGKTARLADIRIKIQPKVKIQGRVQGGRTGAVYSIGLRRTPWMQIPASFLEMGASVNLDGSFLIEAPPGSFSLTGSEYRSRKEKVSKPLMLELGDHDISGVAIDAAWTYEVNGRIVTEGPETIEYSQIRLYQGAPLVAIESGGFFHASLNQGFENFRFAPMPKGWYLKEVILNGRTVPSGNIAVDAGTSELTFVLAAGAAEVEVVPEPSAQGLSAAGAFLLPEHDPIPARVLMKIAENSSARLLFFNVPPGVYRLFVVTHGDGALLNTPEVLMERFRESAPLITIAPGEKKSVKVPLVNRTL